MRQTTHEDFINAVRTLAVARIEEADERRRLLEAKLVYGVGALKGARGVTFYQAWQNGRNHDFIELCALGEESDVQLAGTTIHELGHVLAGPGTGHGKEWKAACARLGLTVMSAGGQAYEPDHFAADLRVAIAALPTPTDGRPMFRATAPGLKIVPPSKPRPCPLGIGTRGGKSRGAGSGSRLRLYLCACPAPFRIRVASDELDATCNRCRSAFTRAEQPRKEAA